MNSNFEDLSSVLENHCSDVEQLMEALTDFHDARERTYNLSFARRGESGVWMNLARKYDRLDLLAARVLEGQHNSNDGVTLVDTLVDTAMYALKWVAVIRSIRPGDFQKWVEQVYCRDTGKSVEEALVEFSIHGPVVEGVIRQLPIHDSIEARINLWNDWYTNWPEGEARHVPCPIQIGELIADIREYAPYIKGDGTDLILNYRKEHMTPPIYSYDPHDQV